ncbi:MAG: DUF4387 family protein, partial [Rhizobium sp.]|nr:DUF4387 family protein [Rhizobium sp.]
GVYSDSDRNSIAAKYADESYPLGGDRPRDTILGIDQARLTDFVEYDPAYAIKFTILRLRPSGSPGDADIFGAQQYAPFLDVEVRDI